MLNIGGVPVPIPNIEFAISPTRLHGVSGANVFSSVSYPLLLFTELFFISIPVDKNTSGSGRTSRVVGVSI
ncbi:hypothetical protein AX774_g4380 [Zancudomyces culisetae]|uniref:Uncharacterized protein n=1 Tax=Zancudomyces culisetae TaxID=1213189 RepID=A0A1R1PMI2_ZANCU|nr:hypothetical protein AX774_g4380 [Zancudomyces culisetae]|eukprot:OMH82157.1 hypothetical protein AX774_g4380 [Zancudomyces culisetae]